MLVKERETSQDGKRRVVKVLFYKSENDKFRQEKDKAAKTSCCFCLPTPSYIGSGVKKWYLKRYWEGRLISYGHVELMFSDGTVTSMTGKGGLHYDKQKMLSNTGYSATLDIMVTPEEEAAMQYFAERLHKSGQVQFNQLGQIWNFWPVLSWFPVRTKNEDYFFCSEFITAILQRGDVMLGITPGSIDPNSLYYYLRYSGVGIPSHNTKLLRKMQREGKVPSTPNALARKILFSGRKIRPPANGPINNGSGNDNSNV